MLTRVFVAAALAVAFMVGVKDGRLLDRAGLTASCTSVAAPRGDTMAWEACRPGKLEGYPDLTRRACKEALRVGRIEYWRCPRQGLRRPRQRLATITPGRMPG